MQNNIADGIVQSATREPIAGTAALALLKDATELFVAQGQRVLRFDLVAQRPADEQLLQLLLGRSGKLRAPAFRCSTRLIVGYNQALLPMALG